MKALLIILSSIFVCSCISKEEVPSNIIPIDKMAEAMAEFLIAEDITYKKGFPIDSSKQLLLGNYKPIILDSLKLEINHFDSSYNFYLEHPELFEEVIKQTEKILEPKSTPKP